MHLTFLGGAGTVTGSKFLIEEGGTSVLADCGLFQGYKQLRLRNREPLGIDPARLASVFLTHAHLDHSGYLPLLIRAGFKGPVHCTQLTQALCEILLPDAGRIQEHDAELANRGGYTKHRPALPLYTEADALRALKHLEPHPFETGFEIANGWSLKFLMAGHIPGAAIAKLDAAGRTIVFSGDLGRYNSPVMHPPQFIDEADYLLLESTYGGSVHTADDPEVVLSQIISRTVLRGGTVVIPSFAVGRAQLLLFHLSRLKVAGRLPDVPIYLDSPMAINASELFCAKDGGTRLTQAEARTACSVAEYVRKSEDSRALDLDPEPKIILSASGMATGGRVLNHLARYVTNPHNTILFAGYQAGGTRGAHLLAGADKIKIHGAWHPVRAEVKNLDMLSAHADSEELMRWLSGFRKPPRRTFIVHGEPDASDRLRQRIEETLGWNCSIAEHRAAVALD